MEHSNDEFDKGQDLVRPLQEEGNHSRPDPNVDARNLLMSRWYRSMQIPLPEVACLVNNATSQQVSEKNVEPQISIKEHIQASALLLDKITEIHHELAHIDSRLNQCRIKRVPRRYRLKQTRQKQLLKEQDLRGMVHEWMDLQPFTFFSLRIENGDVLMTNNDVELEYNWGVALMEEDAHKLGVQLNDRIEVLPAVRCMSSVIRLRHHNDFSYSSFSFMIDEMKRQGLEIKDNITGRILMDDYEGGALGSYLEVNIPI
ncbi:MerR family transcriptional regulator [Paenibacillus sp. sgz500958]|uniref:MerR family transcriptional regulator n=1 Tax=Paenibacillus sp. sgz500958 TaxID=3242475 RepID=UPI0036D344F4